jgi:serine/threonine protein kinase
MGGISEIFLAAERTGRGILDRKVIIKKLLPQFCQNPAMTKLIHYEARLLAALNHANIVQIYDAGIDGNDNSFLVQEFIDGVDLKAFFNITKTMNVKISPSILYFIAEQILRALVHVHELQDKLGTPYNIIHRDISPTNIMVSTSGDVKLLDFGLSKRAIDITVSGNIAGKIPYMAPEQLGKTKVDPRIDLFALGSVLYEISSGMHRYNGESDLEIINKILNRDEKPFRMAAPHIPQEMATVFLKSMRYDRNDRYQSARDMLQDLSKLPLTYPKLRGGRSQLQDFMNYYFGMTKIETSSQENQLEITLVTSIADSLSPPMATEIFEIENSIAQAKTVILQLSDAPLPPPEGFSIINAETQIIQANDYIQPRSFPSQAPSPGFIKPKGNNSSLLNSIKFGLPLVLILASIFYYLVWIKGADDNGETTVRFSTSKPNSHIFLDNKLICKLPCEITFPPGDDTHEIKVETPGFFTWNKKYHSGNYPRTTKNIRLKKYSLQLKLMSDFTGVEISIVGKDKKAKPNWTLIPVIINDLIPNSLITLNVKYKKRISAITISLPKIPFFSTKIDVDSLFKQKIIRNIKKKKIKKNKKRRRRRR